MLFAAAVVVSCAVSGPAEPLPPPATREYHVRALDPRVREWIELGAANSRTLDGLLSRLAKSDVIVYVQVLDRIPGGAAGQIFFVTSTETARYLRIELDGRRSLVEILATLGHELEHAAEIAAAPHVRDSRAMAAMYLRPGDPSTWYDSAAARLTGERVRDELGRTYARTRDRTRAGTKSQP